MPQMQFYTSWCPAQWCTFLRCDFPKYFLCSSVVILKQMCLLPLKGNTGRLEGIEFPCSLLVKTSIFNAAGFCIKLITMEAI